MLVLGDRKLDPKTDYNGVFSDPSAFAKRVHLLWLGVGTKERVAVLPDVPTVAESVPGYEAKAWFGLFAPAGTPVDIVAKLNAEVQAMAADSEFREKVLGPYQMSPIASSPAEFAAFVKNEAAMWKAIWWRFRIVRAIASHPHGKKPHQQRQRYFR